MENLQYQNPTPKKRTRLKIIIAVLALFFVCGVGYGGWKILGGNQDLAVPSPSDNWQTHSNRRIGYSFRYPRDFEFKIREEGFDQEAITLMRPANRWKQLFIFIKAQKYPTQVSPREYADWYYPINGSFGFDDIVISNIQGIQKDLSNPKTTTGEVILTKGSTVVQVNYVTEELKYRDGVLELLDQILNRFQLY